MSWSLVTTPELPFIEVVYSGNITPDELAAALAATAKAAKDSARYLFLANCQQLARGHSVTDLYYTMMEMDRLIGAGVRFREAVLLPAGKDSDDLVKFWETICVNRGFSVQLFHDRLQAVAWLTQLPPKTGAT